MLRTVNASVTLHLNASEPLTAILVRGSNGTSGGDSNANFGDWVSPVRQTSLARVQITRAADGLHRVEIRAVDVAGNIGVRSTSFAWVRDTSK